MDWIILIVSGAMEAVWAQALDRSEGFSQPVPTLIFSPRSQRACSDSAMPSVRFRWAPPTPPGSASGPRSRSRGASLREPSRSHGQSSCSSRASLRASSASSWSARRADKLEARSNLVALANSQPRSSAVMLVGNSLNAISSRTDNLPILPTAPT